jgi:hypothetical protein
MFCSLALERPIMIPFWKPGPAVNLFLYILKNYGTFKKSYQAIQPKSDFFIPPL